MTLGSPQTQVTETAPSFWRTVFVEYGRRLFHPVSIVACISCSLLFAFIGPYNTYASDPLWFRLLFWAGVVVSSCVLAVFCGVWANVRFQHKPFWFHSAIGGSVFSVIYFLFMWQTLNFLFSETVIPHPAELYAVIVSVSALVYICMWFFSAMVNKRATEISGIHEQPAEVTTDGGITFKRRSPTVRRVLREYRVRLLDPVNIAFCVLGSLLFAFIGLFGTLSSESFLVRFVFWSLLVWSTSIITLLFAVWANLRYATRPFWFHSGIGSTVFSVIYLVLIWIALRAIYPPLSFPEYAEFFCVTLLITSVIYVAIWYFSYMVEMRILHTQTDPPLTAPLVAPITGIASQSCPIGQFLRKIGPDAGSKLIRLSMSDHYIEAHTDTGMHLVYMRFADAISDLSAADGAQVHRSHWVNFDEIKSVSKDSGNSYFVMSDDALVPIARSRKKDLQDRGLL